MREMIYGLQFKGNVQPGDDSGKVLKASAVARSSTLATLIDAKGIESHFRPAAGGEASFESIVQLSADDRFTETGSISFGENRIHFETVGEGTIKPVGVGGLNHGSVIWRVKKGEGVFEGAGGLITSNFTVSDSGEVTDYQMGVFFLK